MSNKKPIKKRGELMCSGRINNSCFTSGTRRVILDTNSLLCYSSFLFILYRCEAINFRLDNNTCFFVDQRVSSTVVPETGYVYSDISNWNTVCDVIFFLINWFFEEKKERKGNIPTTLFLINCLFFLNQIYRQHYF